MTHLILAIPFSMFDVEKDRKSLQQHLPKSAVQWLNQALCFYQSLCLFDSEVLRNRQSSVAANVTSKPNRRHNNDKRTTINIK
ncbi:MAG: hypothetical protein IPH02_00400 [Sphingobacteriales bacterium]|nr:hypothetical protein [Sphingobacteriales bacterium]